MDLDTCPIERIDNAEHVESVIDHIGIGPFLDLVRDVCNAKAEHVATNWQDEPLAQAWTRISTALDRIVTHGQLPG